MLLFGNLNPLDDVELKTDAELAKAMAKQIAVGKKSRRFVISTGSPLTPRTTLARMQKYIEFGHKMSAF
jgi:uroporphyrinogen-III decarboxylase